jgi:hypothetical protein
MNPWSRVPGENDEYADAFDVTPAGSGLTRRLIGLRTPLGIGRPRLSRDGTLSVDIGGEIRPLQHFDSSQVAPVYGRAVRVNQEQSNAMGGASAGVPVVAPSRKDPWSCSGVGAAKLASSSPTRRANTVQPPRGSGTIHIGSTPEP